MNNKIFFLPAAQVDNTGDVLINKALLDQLRNHGELVVDDHQKPDWFLKEIGVKSSERLSNITNEEFFGYLQICLKQNKAYKVSLVIHPGHTTRFGYKKSIYGDHGLLYTRFLRRLKKQGCRILRFGFSSGPYDIFNLFSEFVYTTAYKSYAVRDSASYSLGKKYFFRNLVQMPDLAWSFKNSSQAMNNNPESYVVLSFRSNKFGSVHSSEYLQPIIEHLKQILPADKKIKIVYQVKYDQQPAKEIYNSLLEFNNVEFLDEKLDLQTAADLYKNADYIISNRLHVLLLGTIQQVLAFPLVISGDNDKIINIYKDNGLQDCILYLKDETNKNKNVINKMIADLILEKRKLQHIIDKNDETISAVISKSFI